MAQTYKQIQKQIEQLQRQAEALRSDEIKGVVDRIKVAISHYGLTLEQLGFGASKTISQPRKATKPSGKSLAKFSDGSGNVWSGRGPRPHWLRDALAAGRSVDEFRVGARKGSKPVSSNSGPSEVMAPAPTPAGSKSKRAPSKIRYSDGAGNSWSGRGPKPKWLKQGLDAGKTLEDFTN